MSEIKGVLTTLNHRLPAGLDGNRLAQWRLRNGLTYRDFRNQIAVALDALNAEVLGAWGDLVYVTEDDHFEYPNGGAITDMPKITDLSRMEPTKSSTSGHMIDLWRRGDAVGGTDTFFRDTRETVWRAQVREKTYRGVHTFEKDLLGRFFNDAETLLGTNGYDLPFANGSPGAVSYAPPAYGGKVFAANHNHYIGKTTSSTNLGDLLEDLAATVHEHGHPGPYIALVAQADAADYRKLKNFIMPVSNQIVIVDQGGISSNLNTFFERGQVQGQNRAGAFVIGRYSSSYGEIELRATARIPTQYAGLYKSYGINDERNPIGIRVHPSVGFGFRILEEPSVDPDWPVKTIYIVNEYGVSCGADRTAGAAGFRNAGAAWVNPTIS